ncbi:hypothetical protein IFR05_008240, partial [Cadophora sp. M221]
MQKFLRCSVLTSAGSLGAPLDLTTSSELITYPSPTDQGTNQYRIINIPAITNAKLNAFFSRESQNDYQDIIFLLMKYPQEIYDCRGPTEAGTK